MTIEQIGSLGELIAAIATVITLIYLTTQIRQNNRSLAEATSASANASHSSIAATGLYHTCPGILDVVDSPEESTPRRLVEHIRSTRGNHAMIERSRFSGDAAGRSDAGKSGS